MLQITIYLFLFPAGMKLDRRIEEAVPAGQQLQELGMRLRCDDASSDQVINSCPPLFYHQNF